MGPREVPAAGSRFRARELQLLSLSFLRERRDRSQQLSSALLRAPLSPAFPETRRCGGQQSAEWSLGVLPPALPGHTPLPCPLQKHADPEHPASLHWVLLLPPCSALQAPSPVSIEGEGRVPLAAALCCPPCLAGHCSSPKALCTKMKLLAPCFATCLHIADCTLQTMVEISGNRLAIPCKATPRASWAMPLSPGSVSSHKPLSWVQKLRDTAVLQQGSAWGCSSHNQSS